MPLAVSDATATVGSDGFIYVIGGALSPGTLSSELQIYDPVNDEWSLGASLARCRGATLDMEVGGGVAYEISSVLFDALKRMLPPGTDIPDKAEAKKNVLHRSQIVPDVPLCTGAGG